MGKRFAILIGVAAAGVMTLGAQTATAATYNTKVTINQDRGGRFTLIHGHVQSGVRKCEVGRLVALFKQQPGADRLLGTGRSEGPDGGWGKRVPQAKAGWQVYARVRRESRPAIGLVCRRGRSPIFTVL
jgi:hypothetical protein